LKLTTEFSDKQLVQEFLQMSGLFLQDIEEIPPDLKYNGTAHQRIHGKVDLIVQSFKDKRIHLGFSLLGIDESSVIN
jgi:hypothetical protein